MSEQERLNRIAKMCREILDTEEPFYWNYDLSEQEKDLTVDSLLRAVLGFAEREDGAVDSINYIEGKFFSAYNELTGKEVYPY